MRCLYWLIAPTCKVNQYLLTEANNSKSHSVPEKEQEKGYKLNHTSDVIEQVCITHALPFLMYFCRKSHN